MGVRRTRNDQKFWYCLLDPENEHKVLDENGNRTGEVIPQYGEAYPMWANISPATGQAQTEQFGNLDIYDKVIWTRDTDCPIDENSLLFLDKAPEYTTVTTYEIVPSVVSTVSGVSETSVLVPVSYQMPKNDYIVKRVARALNSVSIAVRKVDVG